jgi:methylmalonyl-CoA mutase, C-terminal domain
VLSPPVTGRDGVGATGVTVDVEKRKIRVLIAKVGLDGHDRGAKFVAHELRNAGMEVIYTGIRQTADQVANTAVQEAVDVVGLSFLSGDHMVMVPKVIEKLKNKGREDVKLLVGGIILEKQIPQLLAMGVHQVFLPGTHPDEIAKYILANTG